MSERLEGGDHRGDDGMGDRRSVLLIACGALARELLAVTGDMPSSPFKIRCLPAHLHNTPERIPGEVRRVIRRERGRYAHIFVAYGDCGTGGRLDAVLKEEGVERLPGAHCYSFFMGEEAFLAEGARLPTAFYLTDFLVRHFDRLVYRGLGLDRYPELREVYFSNYTHVVYLAQSHDEALKGKARAAADRLGLDYHFHFTGLSPLASALDSQG